MRNVLMCGMCGNYMYYMYRGEKRPTEGGMRNVLMCGNYMYRGLQGEE